MTLTVFMPVSHVTCTHILQQTVTTSWLGLGNNLIWSNSCTSSYQSVHLLKFADDTTLIGLMSDEDEFDYRWEIDCLVT